MPFKTSISDGNADRFTSFVHQYDEEFNTLKKERRAGRPASTREDLLRIKIAADEKEYENGFCWCPEEYAVLLSDS